MSIGFWIIGSTLGGAFLAVLGWGFQRLLAKQDRELERIHSRLEKDESIFRDMDARLKDMRESITANQYHQQLAIQRLSIVIDQLSKSVEFLARRSGQDYAK